VPVHDSHDRSDRAAPRRDESVLLLLLNGLSCRARSSVEHLAGLGLAGLVALAATTQIVMFTYFWREMASGSIPLQHAVVWAAAIADLATATVSRFGRRRFWLFAAAPLALTGLVPTGATPGEIAGFYVTAALATCSTGTRTVAMSARAVWGWYSVAFTHEQLFDTYSFDIPAWPSPNAVSLGNTGLALTICGLGLALAVRAAFAVLTKVLVSVSRSMPRRLPLVRSRGSNSPETSPDELGRLRVNGTSRWLQPHGVVARPQTPAPAGGCRLNMCLWS